MNKLQGEINDVLKQSINTKVMVDDCVKFDFDIKIFKVKGKFCKSGVLDFTVYAFGVEIQHGEIDLSNGKYCNKISIGVEEVKYCFYIKGSCLYTSGYVDGWFHDKQTWNAKIICF